MNSCTILSFPKVMLQTILSALINTLVWKIFHFFQSKTQCSLEVSKKSLKDCLYQRKFMCCNYIHFTLQVADIRNTLSHMSLGKGMMIDTHQFKEYFKTLNSLVDCLEKLYPRHFTTAADIRANLRAVSIQ